MQNMINIDHLDLTKLLRNVYALSVPVRLGHIHAEDGELPDDILIKTLSDIIKILREPNTELRPLVSWDYLLGRQCKFHIDIDGAGELWIDDRWYDHTPEQFSKLLMLSEKDEPNEMSPGMDYTPHE